MGLFFNYWIRVLIIAFVAILVLIGLVRWGLDSVYEQFWGKRQRRESERFAKKRFDTQKVTYPVSTVPIDNSWPDAYVAGLVREGKLEEALEYARDSRVAATEMDQEAKIKKYFACEERIRKLIRDQKTRD